VQPFGVGGTAADAFNAVAIHAPASAATVAQTITKRARRLRGRLSEAAGGPVTEGLGCAVITTLSETGQRLGRMLDPSVPVWERQARGTARASWQDRESALSTISWSLRLTISANRLRF